MMEILIPIDFSECSLNAFEYAKQFAENCEARLHLLYVDDDAILMQPTTDPSFREPHERQMKERLDHLLTADEQARFAYVSAVRVGTAYHEIERYAIEKEVDLIVVGNLGRTVVGDMLCGSVSSHVIHHAPCPVLSVKNPTYSKRSKVDSESARLCP